MSQQITLSINQAAIEAALIAYVKDMGIDLSNADTSVSLTAGRGANGYTADITIQKQSSNQKTIPEGPIKRTSGEVTKKLEPVENLDKEDDALEISEEEEETISGPSKSIFG